MDYPGRSDVITRVLVMGREATEPGVRGDVRTKAEVEREI